MFEQRSVWMMKSREAESQAFTIRYNNQITGFALLLNDNNILSSKSCLIISLCTVSMCLDSYCRLQSRAHTERDKLDRGGQGEQAKWPLRERSGFA